MSTHGGRRQNNLRSAKAEPSRTTGCEGQQPPLIDQWIPALRVDGKSKYVGVVRAIEQGIADGQLTPGMRLPPQREIASYFGVTIATVTKAISLATSRGLVVARPGSGTYIAKASPAPRAQAGFSDIESVPSSITQDLSLNAPPVAVVMDLLQDNFQELAQRGLTPAAFDYDPIPGHIRHRAAASQWMHLRGLETSPDHILVTQGAHEGLLICLSALTQPGDVVLCERLNYTGLRRIGQLLRIRLVGVDMDDEGMCTDSLTASLKKHQPKAIVCTPVTHNPTTITYSKRSCEQLGRIAAAAAVPVIEDDIYGLFGRDQTVPLSVAHPENTILVTSLCKTVAAGIRIGYVVAGANLLPRLRDEMFTLGWTAPSLQMTYATHLIESGRASECLERHSAEAIRRLQMARKILGTALQSSSEIPTYHVWVATGATRPSDLSAELYRQGILVSPASHFVIGDGASSPQALRLSLGQATDLTTLKLPLELIAHRLSDNVTSMLGSIV